MLRARSVEQTHCYNNNTTNCAEKDSDLPLSCYERKEARPNVAFGAQFQPRKHSGGSTFTQWLLAVTGPLHTVQAPPSSQPYRADGDRPEPSWTQWQSPFVFTKSRHTSTTVRLYSSRQSPYQAAAADYEFHASVRSDTLDPWQS
jgi:hypothetical protein